MRNPIVGAAVVVAWALGCGGNATMGSDGSVRRDAGVADTGVLDADAMDSDVPDTGAPDADVTDGSPSDGAPPADAEPDGPLPDGCCATDDHCTMYEPPEMRCVTSVGRCKPVLSGGECWTAEDCGGGTCEGAVICPCGVFCLVPDSPGTCT